MIDGVGKSRKVQNASARQDFVTTITTIMRIDIPLSNLPLSLCSGASKAGPSSDAPPLLRIGDELVLLELQGTLETEGDVHGELVGRLDLSNPVSLSSVMRAV